ncbi:MAG: AAA family ATPase [Candidatus Bipolaricaulia bacterium]
MPTEEEIQHYQEKFRELREEIGRVIVGHEAVIRGVLISLLCSGHVLLEGVPGLGKTLLVRTLGNALGLGFSRIQFTPDLMPADIIGTNIIMENERGKYFQFARGPIFSNMVLADEINRATPKTQSALLEAMEERTVTVGDTSYELDWPFMVLATQNPIEMEGTFPLPEAQVDRFFLKLNVRYPSQEELEAIIERNTEDGLPTPEQILSRDEVLAARKIIAAFPVASRLRTYVTRLVYTTHPGTDQATELVNRYIEYGASPRAGLSLIMGAKANAFLEGEYHVRIKDIETVFHPSLNHRIILNFRGESEGVQVEEILRDLWEQIPE